MKIYNLFTERKESHASTLCVLYFFKKEDVSDTDLQGVESDDVNVKLDLPDSRVEIVECNSFAEAKEYYLNCKKSMQNFYN